MPKILVIEDDTLIRQEIIDCLTPEGYDTIQANSGWLSIQLILDAIGNTSKQGHHNNAQNPGN